MRNVVRLLPRSHCQPVYNSMPKSTILSDTSLHFGLYEDDCVESYATKPEVEHTLTAFGELSLSQEEILGFPPSDIRRRNQLRLKARRKSAQYSPQIPEEKSWDPLTFSQISTPLTPTEFFNRFRHTVRRAYQRAQAEGAEAETQSRTADSGKSTPSDSSASHDYQPGQSVIVNDFSSVSEVRELVKEWRKPPLRPGIPKWDVDD
ncbi:uncharacterized protein EDB93DRAFT_553678 [Suillus bovinus]|uniref:uncharacterized protein n=1 Tax=Suillus bovinus TaxID=48563 RepID=UPI001B87CA99|nr:uncharacterized protein EDB93DRAFT_553678 [Suillus bovinus]KAG2158569.1 hypothetical protein EDB93DRAFT_553678 [Suillus bovinus]